MSVLRRVCVFLVVFLIGGGVGASTVGPMLTIVDDGKENLEPAVAYTPTHDAFLVVWRSVQDAFTHDIWARAVTTNGDLLQEFVVDTKTSEEMNSPDVAYGSIQDEYLVVYASSSDIWARRVAWNGPGTSSRFLIVSESGPAPGPARVAYNSEDDEFLVVYAGGSGIQAVRVTAATGLTSAPQTIAANTAAGEREPDVAYDHVNNRYLISYRSSNPISGSYRIVLRTASADLTSISSEQELVSQSDAAYEASIDVGPTSALVSWTCYSSMTRSICGRRTALDGTPLGPAGGSVIQSGTLVLYKESPAVSYAGNGVFFVAWGSEDTSTGDGNIQGCYVSATADQLIGERFGIDTSPGDQMGPVVASTGDGESLTVMLDRPNPTPSDNDVIGYMVTFGLFSDGFESGDCTEWSSVTGEAP